MNKILLLCLFTLALSVSEGEKGPAHYPKHSQSEEFCVTYFPYDEDINDWTDNDETLKDTFPISASECVDTLLWDKYDNRYYDRCCYVRFQIKGEMHGGCALLTEEQYLDIAETMRRIEEGDPLIIDKATANSKVYQLDCNSYFIKAFSIVSFLLLFIF